jgi:peptidoglycan DL-endopeptidase CwlO
VRSSTRKVVFTLAATAVLLAVPAAAHAEPLSSKRAEADAVMAQIRELDASVSRAVDAWNAARIRLDGIQAEQRANQRHLKLARTNFGRAQRALQTRLLALYTFGTPSSLEILLGAKSLDDLISRADTVSRVSAEDARILREIRAFRVEMKRREARLARARAEQEDAIAELAAQRRAIEAQLAERRSLLESIKSEIARIEAAEARRQARLQAQARARLAADPPANAGGAGGESAAGGGAGGGQAASSSPSDAAEAAAGASAPPPRHGSVVGIAMRYLGVPYRWGGASPSGFDCSGFVMYVFAQVGVSLPHNAAMQYGYGSPVSRSQLAPGDVVFFNGLGHNGIYIGGGQFIHSPHTGDVVKISSLSDSWYARTYVGARRM